MADQLGAILTGQGHISKVGVIPQAAKSCRNIFFEPGPIETKLVSHSQIYLNIKCCFKGAPEMLMFLTSTNINISRIKPKLLVCEFNERKPKNTLT